MRAKINSVHFKTDSNLEDFIQDKVAKFTNTYENIISSDITLKIDNTSAEENKIAEIRIAVPGNDLYAKKQAKTFEEATDSALDALKKQLNKHKDKFKK